VRRLRLVLARAPATRPAAPAVDIRLQRHVGGIQTAADRAELKAEVQSSMEMGEQAEAFRECPKCGSVNY
jgi:hypothetical protein